MSHVSFLDRASFIKSAASHFKNDSFPGSKSFRTIFSLANYRAGNDESTPGEGVGEVDIE